MYLPEEKLQLNVELTQESTKPNPQGLLKGVGQCLGRSRFKSLDILLCTKFPFLMLQECPEKGNFKYLSSQIYRCSSNLVNMACKWNNNILKQQ